MTFSILMGKNFLTTYIVVKLGGVSQSSNSRFSSLVLKTVQVHVHCPVFSAAMKVQQHHQIIQIDILYLTVFGQWISLLL